jgi:hypothetical protein
MVRCIIGHHKREGYKIGKTSFKYNFSFWILNSRLFNSGFSVGFLILALHVHFYQFSISFTYVVELSLKPVYLANKLFDELAKLVVFLLVFFLFAIVLL